MTAPRRALLSVADKTGIVELAQGLDALGFEILSTGGTAARLTEAGIRHTAIADHTGFPEIMDGRLKTLHPRIHGGLLGRPGVDDEVMAEHDIAPIELLAVNLYPFETVITRPDCDRDTALENIDIGGPAMVRAAAKNHDAVTVLVDPGDYRDTLDALRSGGPDSAHRRRLARKAFAHTARYDGVIARYLDSLEDEAGQAPFPEGLTVELTKVHDMRYGENPHQAAAFYAQPDAAPPSLATARLVQGKPLSFNNVADADAAVACALSFDLPACVIVKHANPCGAACAEDIADAYEAAFATDPTAAFGGIIAFNRDLDAATAARILERQFVEVIAAPGIDDAALDALAAKPGIRVLACGEAAPAQRAEWDYRSVLGGVLVQQRDSDTLGDDGLSVVSRREPDAAERRDLLFTWHVARFVKSNAIVLGRDGRTLGVGAGQMSRVYSARIAALKAADEGLDLAGSVMASDAFFPFRDGIDAAARNGVAAVIQPGGSKRDREVIDAADEHGMAMVFTGTRHFRH